METNSDPLIYSGYTTVPEPRTGQSKTDHQEGSGQLGSGCTPRKKTFYGGVTQRVTTEDDYT